MTTYSKDYIEQIAEETNYAPDEVRTILSRATDIAIEMLMIDGEFTLYNLVKITSKDVTRGYSTNPADPDAPRGVKTTRIFTARVSRTLKRLLKIQRENFPDKPGIINRDTWRGAVEWGSGAYEYKRDPEDE